MKQTYHYQDQLESARLRTRFIVPEDINIWIEFFHEPEAIELFPNYGLNTLEERVQHWINKQLTRYAENRYGLQMMLDKQTGEVIGQCGLLLQEVDGFPELEVGYHMLKKHWGKGYAPEAARLFLSYAFEHGLADSVISMIDVRNDKSMRVAEKNGLRREKQTTWNGLDMYIYRTDPKSFYLLYPNNHETQ